MTVQITQIQPNEPRLLPDSSTQNAADNSFQNHLENEQKRLGLMFSPFGSFNFNSWFSYPDFSFQAESGYQTPSLFSDLNLTAAETTAQNFENTQQNANNGSTLAAPAYSQLADYFATQATLQELLLKTGWLTPNSEISPQFYLAQLQGKLLGKLDLQSLVDQILSQIKLVKEKGKVELTVGLRPKDLGEILLTLTSRSGMISIQIQAPDETRKLLEEELLELELALKKANVNLAEIKIAHPKEVSEDA